MREINQGGPQNILQKMFLHLYNIFLYKFLFYSAVKIMALSYTWCNAMPGATQVFLTSFIHDSLRD